MKNEIVYDEDKFMENILTNYDNKFDANELKAQIDEYFKTHSNLYDKDKTNIIISIAEDINEKYGHNKAQELVDTLIDELNEEKDNIYQKLAYNYYHTNEMYNRDYFEQSYNYINMEEYCFTEQDKNKEKKLEQQVELLSKKYKTIPQQYLNNNKTTNFVEDFNSMKEKAYIAAFIVNEELKKHPLENFESMYKNVINYDEYKLYQSQLLMANQIIKNFSLNNEDKQLIDIYRNIKAIKDEWTSVFYKEMLYDQKPPIDDDEKNYNLMFEREEENLRCCAEELLKKYNTLPQECFPIKKIDDFIGTIENGAYCIASDVFEQKGEKEINNTLDTLFNEAIKIKEEMKDSYLGSICGCYDRLDIELGMGTWKELEQQASLLFEKYSEIPQAQVYFAINKISNEDEFVELIENKAHEEAYEEAQMTDYSGKDIDNQLIPNSDDEEEW